MITLIGCGEKPMTRPAPHSANPAPAVTSKPRKFVAFSADTEAFFMPRDFKDFQGEFTRDIADVCAKNNIPFTWLIVIDKEHVETRRVAAEVFPARKGIDEFSIHGHFKWYIMDTPRDFASFKKLDRRLAWLAGGKKAAADAGLPRPRTFRYGGADSSDKQYYVEDFIFLIDELGVRNFMCTPERLQGVIGLTQCEEKGNGLYTLNGGRSVTLIRDCVYLDRPEAEVLKTVDEHLAKYDYAVIGCHDYFQCVPANLAATIAHLNAQYDVTYLTIDQLGDRIRAGTLKND
jgi:hypothetical protein